MTDTKKFLRQCACCKQYKEKKDLIRLTKDYTTGLIKINNNNKIQGRSVYLCKNIECLEKAIKKKKIEGLLKSNFPEIIKEELANLLTK